VKPPREWPGFSRLAAALRRTTERLAREPDAPSGNAPGWSELEWSIARATCAMQGTTALLAARLRWRGPAAWQGFLADQAAQSRARDARIARLVADLHASLRAAGVAAVGLKGTALRALGVYLPGERPMGDIDLLGHPRDRDAVEAVLRSVGYARAYQTDRHLVYRANDAPIAPPDQPFGEHVDVPLKIELHAAVAEPLPVNRVDITACLRGDSHATGLLPYPTETCLMRHLLLHAAGNMRANGLRQIQLHDIALLAERLGEDQWWELLTSPPGLGGSWWMYPPLALANRYYPRAIPQAPLAEFSRRCPRFLRARADRWTLTDVSWSNLRILAFPGIAWSRSAGEALRFARGRLFPDRRSLRELEDGVKAMCESPHLDWYRDSQATRLRRWLFSRPPRVQTMISIHNLWAADRRRA
jgi:hypothetical protein